MRFLALVLLPALTQAVNIVLSNDDGWAEINIREFYNALTTAGNSVLLSAPAEDKSGTGSSDATPTPLTSPCEFDSCPSGSPATGANASMPRFNYVNSFPVTSMRYGIQNLSSTFFSSSGPASVDLTVAGPNVGANTGLTTLVSGTVGAATEASKEGIPSIAFSGTTGDQTAWNVSSVPDYAAIYADLATNVTDTLVAAGKPYLPPNIWLNVNFPAAGSGTACTSVKQFEFVLSRIDNAVPLVSGADVTTCGNGGRLPTEATVVGTSGGCFASISVGLADTKMDANATEQQTVLTKLGSILSCLPS